ncbi:DinB family protein, partial [Congregibacter sp.]
FNHGTHHRGQVHTMLTAAGVLPGDTDVPFMPAEHYDWIS